MVQDGYSSSSSHTCILASREEKREGGRLPSTITTLTKFRAPFLLKSIDQNLNVWLHLVAKEYSPFSEWLCAQLNAIRNGRSYFYSNVIEGKADIEHK